MHDVDLRLGNRLLPAKLKLSGSEKFLISHSPDKADHFWLIPVDQFSDLSHASSLLTALELSDFPRGLIDQINKIQPVMREEFCLVNALKVFIRTQLILVFRQNPSPVEQIPEGLIIRERYAPPKGSVVRIDPNEENPGSL